MDELQFNNTMEHIVVALEEKGYDPYAQLTGYVTENNITYITNHKGARQLIANLDIEQVGEFVKNMQRK